MSFIETPGRRTNARDRARSFRSYIDRRVTVTMSARDSYSEGDEIRITGRVLALALRVKGRADWAGHQYDMVLKCDDKIVRTFALSRVRAIETHADPEP